MEKIKSVKDHFALVTGASSGIGKAIALELARKQVNLILVALPQTGLPEVADQILRNFKVEVKFCELDLTHSDAANFLYLWCRRQNIKINALINNAGIGTHTSFENTPVSDLEIMLKLNNQSLVMLAYYFLPELKKNGPAHILNVGSLASFMNIPGKAVYSASKSFIYSFSLSLRMEVKQYKINVSCLCPGGTITSDRMKKNLEQVRLAGKFMLQMPDEVAREAIRQMYRGRKLIIPGWQNKFLYKLWAFLPQRIVDMILSAMFFRRDPIVTPKTSIAFQAIAVR